MMLEGTSHIVSTGQPTNTPPPQLYLDGDETHTAHKHSLEELREAYGTCNYPLSAELNPICHLLALL
jgi:hypothetical protein